MLKVLLKKQMMEIFRMYFYNQKTNKARSKGAVTGMMVGFGALMVVVLGGMFAVLAAQLCVAFSSVGLTWMYFAMFALLSIALGTFGSVFNTYAGLYLAKDNDLLLSMPIPVRYIMISRLLGVYLTGLMYSGTVMLPAVLVYFVIGAPTVLSVLGSLLLTVLVSVIVLLLSCLLGWVIAKISRKLKNRNFITVLVSLAVIVVYYFVYFRAQELISAMLTDLDGWSTRLRSAYPLYLLGSVGSGVPLAMVAVAGFVAAAAALLWWRMSRSFLRLATSSGGSAKAVYRERAAKVRSAGQALLGKEFARFTGSAAYMLNCGLGLIFILAAGILILVKGWDLVAVLRESGLAGEDGLIPCFFVGILAMMSGMVDITSPSVSLEGKTVWLAQSLPVTPWLCLRAKLLLQLVLACPVTLFCSICGVIVLRPDWLTGILMLLVPQVVAIFQAAFGLMLNLLRPSLNWSNEMYPIKQSMSVFLALLSGFLLGGVPILMGLFVGVFLGSRVVLLIYGILVTVASLGVVAWLRSRGSEIYAGL